MYSSPHIYTKMYDICIQTQALRTMAKILKSQRALSLKREIYFIFVQREKREEENKMR